MKRIYTILILATSCFIFSCAPQIVTTSEESSSDATATTYEAIPEIIPHTRHCELQNTTTAMTGSGNQARMLFIVLGSNATRTYYSFGFRPESGAAAATLQTTTFTNVRTNEGTTNMIQGKLTINNPSSQGSNSYTIVMRDKLACYDAKGSESASCTLSNEVVDSIKSAYDYRASVTIDLKKDTSTSSAIWGSVLPSVLSTISGGNPLLSALSTGLQTITTGSEENQESISLENRCIEHYVISK